MAHKFTQKQIDGWNKTRERGVRKFQENRKKKVLVAPKKKSPVLKSIPKKKYKLRKRTPKEAARYRKYLKIRFVWFQEEENQYCKIQMADQCKGRPATDVHHTEGEEGELLFDTTKWLPGCRECHDIAHRKDKEAREKGILRSKHAAN